MQKFYFVFLVLSCCFHFLAASTEEPIYLPPSRKEMATNFFLELNQRSDNPSETFATILNDIEQNKDHCHQFQVKHPLKDQD
jgi:hypothetical protein